MSAALKAAVRAVAQAEAAVAAILKRDYPPGTPIAWTLHPGRVTRGEVVANLPGDRIRVLNWSTGRSRDLYAATIVTPVSVFRRVA